MATKIYNRKTFEFTVNGEKIYFTAVLQTRKMDFAIMFTL